MATATTDFTAVKSRQRATWASGDYALIGTVITLMSERLVDTADIPAGSTVLDVACGSGNATLAAARASLRPTGLDYVPALLEQARRRTALEGLSADYIEGDAEALPFEDGSFDSVISVVGAMFAPDQAAVAAELARVCRPGGTIALANWTPRGFVGRMFRTVASHVPPPPGVPSALLWGDEDHVRGLFEDTASSVEITSRDFVFRATSAETLVDHFLTYYGPTLKAHEAVGADGAAALRDDMIELFRSSDRRGGDGPVAIPSEYIEVVATRR